ncbi:MAG: hypothetical protein JWO60_1702 [Frankiales bacterium]|nr:hypothetical protein [Frankiales bacterium]
MTAPAAPWTRSPAVVITVVTGVLALLLSLNSGGFALALFFGAAALAALPMALADRPGPRGVRLAVLGAGMGVVALCLVLAPLLFGEQQQADRDRDPARSSQDRPSLPRSSPAPSLR